MPERNKKFHEFALKSTLFKGRPDWYFCYLKTERIAHVVSVLADRAGLAALKDIAADASSVPGEIARLAAGELDVALPLADIFALLSTLRIAGTRGFITPDNCTVLVKEYEGVAERLVAGSHPSPFGTAEDFFVPELSEPLPLASEYRLSQKDIKDTVSKGHDKGQTPRATLILEYIRKQKSASIKDIAGVIQGCSEKTIQRELAELIRQGLVKRIGERRWSVYTLATRG